jgi:hypothetical protein
MILNGLLRVLLTTCKLVWFLLGALLILPAVPWLIWTLINSVLGAYRYDK